MEKSILKKPRYHQHHGHARKTIAKLATPARRAVSPSRSDPGPLIVSGSRYHEGVGAQRQREEKRKALPIVTWGSLGLYFFRNRVPRSNHEGWASRIDRAFCIMFVCSFAPLPGLGTSRELREHRDWRNFTPRRTVDDFWWREFRAQL